MVGLSTQLAKIDSTRQSSKAQFGKIQAENQKLKRDLDEERKRRLENAQRSGDFMPSQKNDLNKRHDTQGASQSQLEMLENRHTAQKKRWEIQVRDTLVSWRKRHHDREKMWEKKVHDRDRTILAMKRRVVMAENETRQCLDQLMALPRLQARVATLETMVKVLRDGNKRLIDALRCGGQSATIPQPIKMDEKEASDGQPHSSSISPEMPYPSPPSQPCSNLQKHDDDRKSENLDSVRGTESVAEEEQQSKPHCRTGKTSNKLAKPFQEIPVKLLSTKAVQTHIPPAATPPQPSPPRQKSASTDPRSSYIRHLAKISCSSPDILQSYNATSLQDRRVHFWLSPT
ncbi:hypothetical protein DFS34DRAFT_602952 [Phlyctochytrium arcticum]|nr:hypothetical protein DFS34DRAFT_602952 [Phlyctochytrium arcticum]